VRVLRDRVLLLRALRHAGPAAVVGLTVLVLGRALLPAASAVAMALLVGRVEAHAAVWLPLGVFVGVLLFGHLVDAFVLPVGSLVTARIDGAQRAELARLTSASSTVARLEDPDVQDLVRVASADPENWTEKTPGNGAVAQLGLLARWAGAVGAGAVLAAYAWWLVPILVVPAFVGRAMQRRQFLEFARLWAQGARESRRVGEWKEAVMSPAEGKEQRVYGFGEWAVSRGIRGMHIMFDPLWDLRRRDWGSQWATLFLMAVPLGVVYAIVAAGVVHGRASVAIETAVLAAGFAVYLAAAGTYDALEIEGALPVLKALPQLRAVLRDPAMPAAAVRDAGGGAAGPPRIELRGIRFTYPGTDRLILDDLDLTVEPGELLAIVGLNGAGKSTLIKLLAGLYLPDAGTITADGVEVRELGPAGWRERISVVFQDFVRYHLSAGDNVALGHATVPRDQAAIDAAAEEAGLRAVLDRLPHGWDTPLARDRTDGVDLSGGQWQQVVLARALYAVHTGATLLVLDEPTAHLDVRSEAELFDRLVGRAGNISIVLISHRLSTVRHAGRIVLLDGGRITESGTHAQLMALGGGYARMFTIQAERFTRGYDDRIEEDELP
jgi:ATP-binding cassette subfamily B protein